MREGGKVSISLSKMFIKVLTCYNLNLECNSNSIISLCWECYNDLVPPKQQTLSSVETLKTSSYVHSSLGEGGSQFPSFSIF